MQDAETKGLRAISFLSDVMKDPVYRDTLLKIGQLSPDFSVMQVFDGQDSMSAISQ